MLRATSVDEITEENDELFILILEESTIIRLEMELLKSVRTVSICVIDAAKDELSVFTLDDKVVIR